MKLRSLNIELNRWGDRIGTYTGTIHFEDDKETEVKLVMSPELAARFIEHAAPVLMAAADDASQQFKTNLLNALPYVKAITQ